MKLNFKDFNTKSFSQICKIPGIGRKTASRIVSMRPFKTDNDLFKVKGLGKGILLKLGIEKKKKPRKKWITIEGVDYPHYCFAFDERNIKIMDFFWRIPREYRLYYGRMEESMEITKKLRAKLDIELEKFQY